MKKILIAGESWTVHSIHQKGFDSFTTTEYAEGVRWLKAALEGGGWIVDYMPSHVAARDFPMTAKDLAAYDCVMLSDIGANTLLLHPETFTKSRVLPNRLAAIRDYVLAGGGFVMVGGYLTFQGIDAKAQYAGSAVEEVMPVILSRFDDRAENPQGIVARVVADHPIVAGVSGDWPALLGYNRAALREGAELIVSVDGDPLVAAQTFGKGRGVVFSSDCGPHWAPPPFVDWAGYAPLWNGICDWAAGRI
jgi:uncharacterized membrane protein